METSLLQYILTLPCLILIILTSSMNSFGQVFRLTTFGESHGVAVGGVIDGCPSNISLDIDAIQHDLDRRRPGQSALTTARDEKDRIQILSGTFNGVTTGAPIAFMVLNQNQHSSDYSNVADKFRPSHADFTWQTKYGIRDYRGGGRTSARETLARVAGGAIAKQILSPLGVSIHAFTSQVGDITLPGSYKDYDLSNAETNDVRCPDNDTASKMAELITTVKQQGDTIGGVITCVIKGVPVGWGEPLYDRLSARLAFAMLSINAAKGFDYGTGFDVLHRGSQINDVILSSHHTATNNSGGIQGGISNGEDIYFRVAFKPVATILQPQQTIDLQGNPVTLQVHGRHDPCVLPRAVPVVEAMTALTLADAYLLSKAH